MKTSILQGVLAAPLLFVGGIGAALAVSGGCTQSLFRPQVVAFSTEPSSGQRAILYDGELRSEQTISDLQEKMILHRLML